MYTETKQQQHPQQTETKDNTQTASVWKEYSHYHDYFIELLSYGRKHNLSSSSVWNFSYV